MTTGLSVQSQLFNNLAITGRVIVALVLRETKTRFGARRFGYLWAFIEPIVYVSIYIGIRDYMRNTVPFGESIILFMLSGLLTFRIYWSVSSRTMPAISANRALLAYPPVKPMDVIAARLLLETLTMYVVLGIFFLFASLGSGLTVIVNHDSFYAAILAVTLLASGVGTFNAVLTVLLPTWDRIFRLLTIPLFMTSGIFYVPKNLPPSAQNLLSWNPVLHCVEWVRTGIYLSYDPLLDRSYVIIFGMVTLVLGFGMERIFRYRLLSS